MRRDRKVIITNEISRVSLRGVERRSNPNKKQRLPRPSDSQ